MRPLPNQTNFAFLPEVERNSNVARNKWTHICPGQEVKTVYTMKWYEKVFSGGGIGSNGDEDEEVLRERKVEQSWHVYLLPVFVDNHGMTFRLPNYFETINGVDGKVRFNNE